MESNLIDIITLKLDPNKIKDHILAKRLNLSKQEINEDKEQLGIETTTNKIEYSDLNLDANDKSTPVIPKLCRKKDAEKC